MPRTKQRLPRPAAAWSIIAIAFLEISCGPQNPLDSEEYREELKQDIRNALTNSNCSEAVILATPLYLSQYTDNEVRNLYASAQACVAGVRFYSTLDSISEGDFSSLSAFFRTVVQIFPSRTALDSKMQASWNAQDALMAMLNSDSVLAPFQGFNLGTTNPASVRAFDRTADANLFLIFVSMGSLGTALNRYGFAASDNPATTSYVKTVSLPWTTTPLVLADTTGVACSIGSAFYNLIDAANASGAILPSTAATQVNSILNLLTAGVDIAAQFGCVTDAYPTTPYTANQCQTAIARLRYRGACAEQAPAASAAAAIIRVINAGWI